MAAVELAPGAGSNPLAVQMAGLLSHRLTSFPERVGTFERLGGRVAIVAADAETSLTMRFDDRRAVLFDGIVGIPDLTLRASSELIAGLPDRGAMALAQAVRDGRLQIHGLPGALPLLARLGRLLAGD